MWFRKFDEMRFFVLCIFGLVAGINVTSSLRANDSMSTAEALTSLKEPSAKQVILVAINSYSQAYVIVNAKLKNEGQKPMFCQPPTLAITAEQASDILARYSEKKPHFKDFPFGLVLLAALIDVFPCPV